ncbi:MAG: DUF4421 family protein [Bdellovibrionales bacterium]|nr:DUF4421 family protein [Bdellovibrionales bacterium]
MPLKIFLIMTAIFPSLTWAHWSKQPDDNLKVEFGIKTPVLSYDIKAPSDISSSQLKYKPNTNSKTALGFSYRNIGLSISGNNPTSEDSNNKYGKTSSTDFQLRFFGKRTYEFFYQTYSGYYIENSSEIDPSYSNTDIKIQRSDIKTKNYGFNLYWNLDDKDFSQAVAYDQLGVQKESAWGLSWLLHASQSSIESDSTLIPDTSPIKSSFGSVADIKDLHRNSLAGGIGIGGILSYHNFYLASLFALGLGYQSFNYQTINSTGGSSTDTGTYASFRASLGYNGQKNIFGVQLLNDSVNTNILKGQITGVTTEAKIFYAYRFEGVDISFLNYLSSWFD